MPMAATPFWRFLGLEVRQHRWIQAWQTESLSPHSCFPGSSSLMKAPGAGGARQVGKSIAWWSTWSLSPFTAVPMRLKVLEDSRLLQKGLQPNSAQGGCKYYKQDVLFTFALFLWGSVGCCGATALRWRVGARWLCVFFKASLKGAGDFSLSLSVSLNHFLSMCSFKKRECIGT